MWLKVVCYYYNTEMTQQLSCFCTSFLAQVQEKITRTTSRARKQKHHLSITQGQVTFQLSIEGKLAILPFITFTIYLNCVKYTRLFTLVSCPFEFSESNLSKAIPQKLVSDRFSKAHSTMLKNLSTLIIFEFKNQVWTCNCLFTIINLVI